MNDAQQQIISQTCKRHTTKFADREFGRICPSKLNKRELEDLYFAILDKNIELKQTLNEQNEKIKQLSVRVQRLSTIQKTSLGKSERDCCAGGKALIKEQKEIIADQKRTNERLSERVKSLNMRLCSAKQFLSRNFRCSKCCFGTNNSLKMSTISGLNSAIKRSELNLQTMVASKAELHKEPAQVNSVETQTDTGNSDEKLMCDENKCKTLIEELKQKIVAFEGELSKANDEYSKRVSGLERELLTLRQRNGESCRTLQQNEGEFEKIMERLRTAEMQCDVINRQLSVEKRKVTELETRLKSADLSAQVAQTVERHLRKLDVTAMRTETSLPAEEKLLSTEKAVDRQKHPKNSDDSGYMDPNISDNSQSPCKDGGSDLQSKISNLQAQLDSLKRQATVQKDTAKRVSNFEPYQLAIEDDQISILRSINDYGSLMKSSPIAAELHRNKSSDVLEIKSPDSLILQRKDCENLNTVMPEGHDHKAAITSTPNASDVVKYKSSLIGGAQVSDKPEDFHKTQNGKDKITKNVSYEDVKTTLNDEGKKSILNPLLIRGPSDEKHDVRIGDQSSTSNVIENITTKGVKNIYDKVEDDDQMRDCNEHIFDKHRTEKSNHDGMAHYENSTVQAKNIKVDSKLNTKGHSKGSKKISLDLPDSETSLYSRETKTAFKHNTQEDRFKIEVIKSDTSTDKTVKSPIKHYQENEDIKVIKGVRLSSEIKLPKTEKVKSKEKMAVIDNIAETNRRKNNVQSNGMQKNIVKSGVQTQRRSSSGGGTYLVRNSPSPCPGDTDGEISGLTDLPDERDESPRYILSPGEERPTYTDTYTSTAEITLSEGELLVSHARKSLSPGEKKWKNSSGEVSPAMNTQRMEEALQAVCEELARCRQMLQRHGNQATKEAWSMTESESSTIALTNATAQPRIVGEHTHLCRFTFHVGTVVLSDQAVAYSRGKPLLLAWRFYDQQPGMVRMNPGRVLHFDFTTEYRLPLTERFLDYLKREEMLLSICELDKLEEPLASSPLSLRETIALVNRRVYSSLALVASPEMLSNNVMDALDFGDEIGVLDVWCRLKVGPALLPTIRRACKESPDVTARPSSDGKRPEALKSKQTPLTRRELEQKSDFSDTNSIYNIYKSRERRLSEQKLSDGQKKSITIEPERNQLQVLEAQHKNNMSAGTHNFGEHIHLTLTITIVWLALDAACEAMIRPDVQRLYVAYSFLGRDGADLETPVSLPKPMDSTDKCYFNFKKTFLLNECDLPLLGHMVKCKGRNDALINHRDCLIFTVISEPPEDPLGLDICEDIGYAKLYLGDVLTRCAGSDSYTDVLSVKGTRSNSTCGALAVRIAGLRALKNLW